MIDLMRLLNALALGGIVVLFFAMLWIVIFTSVSMAIKIYWPEEDEGKQKLLDNTLKENKELFKDLSKM